MCWETNEVFAIDVIHTYTHILKVLSYRACLEWILLGLNSFLSALNTCFPNHRPIACLNSILSKCRAFITYPWKVTIWSWEVQTGSLLFRRYGIKLFSGLWVLQFSAIFKLLSPCTGDRGNRVGDTSFLLHSKSLIRINWFIPEEWLSVTVGTFNMEIL